jgi:hypothetical protein
MGITPVVGSDLWALQSAVSEEGSLAQFTWGGGATASTAMRLRVARPATLGVTPTAAVAQKKHPFSQPALILFASGWATQPVLAANEGDFVQEWNAHGGVGRWVALEEAEKVIVTGAAAAASSDLSCRAEAGTGLSSYTASWDEP